MPAQLLAFNDRRASDADPIGDGGGLSFLGIARTYARDQQIFAEGGDTGLVYKVVSGAVRTVRLLADGRRQVTGFHFVGDIFGVDLRSTRYEAAEAVGEAVVKSARRSSLAAAPGEALWRYAMGQLQRSQDHVLALGRRSAAERVASFLLDQAERLGVGDAFALPMSRQDIADYLGLTIETVSRTLTQLQADGLVRVTGCRQIGLLRPAALAGLCE